MMMMRMVGTRCPMSVFVAGRELESSKEEEQKTTVGRKGGGAVLFISSPSRADDGSSCRFFVVFVVGLIAKSTRIRRILRDRANLCLCCIWLMLVAFLLLIYIVRNVLGMYIVVFNVSIVLLHEKVDCKCVVRLNFF